MAAAIVGSGCFSTAKLRACHAASTWTKTENGLLRDGRLYELVREYDAVRDRTLEIMFLEPGAEGYMFTFG